MTHAFPPRFRLHFSWQYRAFFQGAQVLRLRECSIFRIPNEIGHYRLGISIKARGRAVDRNHVKRRLREWFRKNESLLGAFDYNVLIPAHKKIGFPYPGALASCLQQEFTAAIHQTNRWSRVG